MHNIFNMQLIILSGVPITEAMWKILALFYPLGPLHLLGCLLGRFFPYIVALRISVMVAEIGPDTAFPLR